MRIHQFSPSIGSGDGVSNGIFFTQKLLRELGFESEIYADLIPDELQHQVKPRSALDLASEDILFFHHSLGYPQGDWLRAYAGKRVLVYHNITPPEFLPDNGLRELSLLGRQQLRDWRELFCAAIADSELNGDELREAEYTRVQAIPLLVDMQRWQGVAADVAMSQKLRGAKNLIFIGRICAHKHQLRLIQVMQQLRHLTQQPVRLILAGGVTSDPYLQEIQSYLQTHQLQQQVWWLGKLNEAELLALYRQADCYVSLSEHEGFGMPLIEAMQHSVPVLARPASGVAETLGEGGIQLDATCSEFELAQQLAQFLAEPAQRQRVLKAQRLNLQRFTRARIRADLQQFLCSLGHPSVLPENSQRTPDNYWQIEGPFDSSYSLAIVNRELAKSLARQRPLRIRSREGQGDFAMNPGFLQAEPDFAQWQSREPIQSPEVVMRNCYPPYLDDMAGDLRVLHSYGWEESGFPAEYVAEFNRKLDLITVVSSFVGKTLRDNGVSVPIAVVGNGADHLSQVAAAKLAAKWQEQLKGFCFLHISSGFPRKGLDALLAAYAKAFRQHDAVTLVIKTFANPHQTVLPMLADWRQRDPEFPHVVVIDEDLPDAEIRAWYQRCDAFVLASRGEGYGLPLAEAMLERKPVITTAYSGQVDFCDATTAGLVDYRFARAESHFTGLHSAWVDPDIDDLARQLRALVDQPVNPAQLDRAQQRIAEQWRWSDVAERTIQAVEQVRSRSTPAQSPKIAWISSWNARCGIAAYSAYLSQAIPEQRLLVLANYIPERMAKDKANVIRCWNADLCEPMDYAWELIQEQQAQALVVQYNFGFFPLSSLARLLQQAHQAGIASYVFFHSTADLETAQRQISLRSIVAELKLATRLIVHGIDDLNRLKDYGVHHNLVLFPQGVLSHTPALDRAATSLPATAKRVIAAYGFLLPHKGLQQLIEAFIVLAKLDQGLHLLLLNSLYPNPISEREFHICNRLVIEAGLQERVTFQTDYLSDAESLAYLQQADLIIYPYQGTQESSSAAVRMGLASGKAVAVTPLAIFKDVAEAVHFLPGCAPDELALGIAGLLDQPEYLAELAKAAQNWCASRNWDVLSERLLGLIDGVANALDVNGYQI